MNIFKTYYIKIYTNTHQIVSFSKIFSNAHFPNHHRNGCPIKMFTSEENVHPSPYLNLIYTGYIERGAYRYMYAFQHHGKNCI